MAERASPWIQKDLASVAISASFQVCDINYIIASDITHQLPSPRKGEKYLDLPQRFLQGLNRIKTAKCLVQLPDQTYKSELQC